MTRTAQALLVLGGIALSGCAPRAIETSGQVDNEDDPTTTTETTETTTDPTTSDTDTLETTTDLPTTTDPGCMSDDDCMGPTPACDTNSGECVPCTTQSGCDQGTFCLDMMECVACIDDTDCPCINNECVECKVDDDCISNVNGQACSSDNLCVACTVDKDAACADENMYCDSANACASPKSCSDLRDWGYTGDGMYWIDFFDGPPEEFMCELDPDGPFGAGWIKVTWPHVWKLQNGVLEALDEGSTSGIDPVNGPFASHDDYYPMENEKGFSYTFTFELSSPYNEFRFSDYKITFTICTTNIPCKLYNSNQDDWMDLAHDNLSAGNILFGSDTEVVVNLADTLDPLNPDDTSGFAGNYIHDAEIVLTTTPTPTGKELGKATLEQPTKTFRIGWGEYGSGQIESISVWTDGAIWFRRSP